MKKITVIILVITLILGLVGCSTANNTKETTLELNHKLENFTPTDPDRIEVQIDYIDIELTETAFTKYTEGVLPELVSLINHQYPNVLNGNWEYMVHFLDEQETAGIIQFRYLINGEIKTNKGIVFNYENGIVNSATFSNIEQSIDEENIIKRVENFKSKHTQEKKKLGKDEEFIKETFDYLFYYKDNKLIYSYNLFFYKGQYELRYIDNSNISEYVIDENGNAVD